MISILNFESLKNGAISERRIENSILFYPDDIYSKYGFADGDLLSDLFFEFCEKNGVRAAVAAGLSHKALYEVVKNLVFANISPNTELDFMDCTCHNPVRAGKNDYDSFSSNYVRVEILDILTVFDRIISEVR